MICSRGFFIHGKGLLMSRVLFIFFLLLTAAAAAYDAAPLMNGKELRLHALGEIWFRLSPGSLNLLQAGLERHVWPPLWDPGVTTLLLAPAVAVFSVLALFFLLLALRRRR